MTGAAKPPPNGGKGSWRAHFEYLGEMLTLAEASRRTGIPEKVLDRRWKSGWRGDKLWRPTPDARRAKAAEDELRPPERLRRLPYRSYVREEVEIDGERMTVGEACKRTGVSLTSYMNRRFARGWPPKRWFEPVKVVLQQGREFGLGDGWENTMLTRRAANVLVRLGTPSPSEVQRMLGEDESPAMLQSGAKTWDIIRRALEAKGEG